ncbi:SAM-dependent methyltransferase [Sphingomicrobium clamense]|uniref:Cyclopropane-fatty-acyl-phospholipid synthase family protein n=1 Tax=Sphingomicrobium clamense TaxID=2851013 RepID=A0ABS6V3J4_9SPHN|nr:cyclopropane-fatty-acyl-phospholipid synthase family protein [Sphingomicrobium sp. B8]MBW0144071.1 cyclopropane-fatty-acyl-phospholipid synthase family protein [Sphingomicrobium sp. B8]
MALLSRLIQKFLKEGQLTLVHPDGRRETLGPGGGEAVTIRFADDKVVRDLMRNPRLMLGEAYMDGRIVFEDGKMIDLLSMVQRSNAFEDKEPGGASFVDKGKIAGLARWLRRNNPVKSKDNVAHHYDLGDDLYDLFLDPWRQYSCAYYEEPGQPLEEAQLAKLAHIAGKLHLREGDHVLDIGCGWGGMARYLHKVAGVRVTGITLSEHQLTYARAKAVEEGVADKVDFQLVDYRKLEGQFDRIVTVGMFEHVGAAHYREFYDACRRLLKRDGVMLNHTIGRLGEAGSPDPFTDKWIFPGYHIPSLSQMCEASEQARLMVSDVEILRLHYAHTLRAWLERVEAKKPEIERLYDERFYRMWEFYLGGAIVMFEHGGSCNYQVQYVRDRRALPITRDYMAEAEARYRAIAG